MEDYLLFLSIRLDLEPNYVICFTTHNFTDIIWECKVLFSYEKLNNLHQNNNNR